MNNPKLRFKANDGSEFPEWEETEIGKIGTFTKGAALSKADISDTGMPFVLYGELYTTYREIAYTIKRKTEAVVNEKYYSKIGDVIIPTSGESPEEISTATCIMVPNVILAGDLNIFRSSIIDGRIMSYILNYQAKNKIATIAQGKSIVHIQAKELSKIKIKYPVDVNEQKKIADFLSTIDEIIQSTESELNAWQERKKGVMQKIFNREVRFKADDRSEFPEWEEAEIGEICVINPKTEEVEDEFLYMDLGSVDHGDWEEPEVMIKSKAPSRAQRAARVGDVFFQSVRPYNQGHFHYSEKKDKQVVASTGYIQIRMKNCDSGFIYQILYDAHFNQEVSIRCTGSNYPAINADDFSEIVIAYPCVEEQRKIAECLSSLDDVINQIDAELSAWKEFKKGLLQQMFV